MHLITNILNVYTLNFYLKLKTIFSINLDITIDLTLTVI